MGGDSKIKSNQGAGMWGTHLTPALWEDHKFEPSLNNMKTKQDLVLQ